MVVVLRAVLATIVVVGHCHVDVDAAQRRSAKSGLGEWVDPDTPDDRQVYYTSRGEPWHLVMSDEFNVPGRDFRPGYDHVWTSLEKPDGVNAGLELYTHEMATTKCDPDDGSCFFQIEIREGKTNHTVYNSWTNPQGYQTVTMKYKSAMVQSWNKFCLQGGMIEVRSRLPGITSSLNPDAATNSKSERLRNSTFYPTWPGIWMYGNLGRAIFTASNDRMWPFSYNECNATVFNASNQRISACDGNPGHGLNPFQGRGSPEIDIIEAGGTGISSSIQIAPGMNKNFRLIEAEKKYEGEGTIWCVYGGSCKTPGANVMGIPTKVYKKRGHKTWYQGLRYASNNFCDPNTTEAQDYKELVATITKGITDNKCPDPNEGRLNVCPASHDFYADFGPITFDKDNNHWNVNSNGTCFPVQNAYTGTFLCSRGNTDCQTEEELAKGLTPMDPPFAYQMDAISANWGMHMAGYMDYVNFQLEWVTGDDGYIRWSLHGQPIFEIPGASLTNPPQDEGELNPRKLMPEEPMYLIINVALSTSWSSSPPNAPRGCRDHDPSSPKWQKQLNEKICDEFPLFMRVDHVRIYQDLSKDSKMSIGCDPKTHPTKQWIEDHLDEYTDEDNKDIKVIGGANCRDDDDCTVSTSSVKTGTCVNHRCRCVSEFWEGPRCVRRVGTNDDGESSKGGRADTGSGDKSFSPSLLITGIFAGVVILVTIYAAVLMKRRNAKADEEFNRQRRLKEFCMTPSAEHSGGYRENGTFNGSSEMVMTPETYSQRSR